MKTTGYRIFKNDILKDVQILFKTKNVDLSTPEINKMLIERFQSIGYEYTPNTLDVFKKNSIFVVVQSSSVVVTVSKNDYKNREHFAKEFQLIVDCIDTVEGVEYELLLCSKTNQIEFDRERVELAKLSKDKLKHLVFSDSYIRNEKEYPQTEKNATMLVSNGSYEQEQNIGVRLQLLAITDVKGGKEMLMDELNNLHTLIYETFIDCISDYLYEIMKGEENV